MGKNKNRRKRSVSELQDAEDGATANVGVAGTLAFLKDGEDPSSGDWTQVEGPASKRRKNKNKKSVAAVDSGEKAQHGEQSKDAAGDRKPSLKFAEMHQLQRMLKLIDLQELLLYCLADGPGPRWVSVQHHGAIQKAVVLMVPGLEKAMFTGEIWLPEVGEVASLKEFGLEDVVDAVTDGSVLKDKASPGHVRYDIENGPDDYLPITLNKSKLPASLWPLADKFEHMWPVKTPGDDKMARLFSPLSAMLTSAIPKSQEEKQLEKNMKGVKPALHQKTWVNERTPITRYIATKEDLHDSDYVLHPALFSSDEEKRGNEENRKMAKTTEDDGWKDTIVKDLAEGAVSEKQIQKGSITAGRTVLAMDCEMCLAEDEEYVLTRISVVGWDGEVILDEYVKPDKPIKDYLTQFSGITPEILASVTTSLADIQGQLLELVHAKSILVGHSLESDFRAIKMTHPFVVDTSIIYPHPRGPPLKSSLKWLAQKYLSREIQKGHGSRGHDSIEDARATLDLVKQKCERGPKWGSSDANTESIFKRLSRATRKGRSVPATVTSSSSSQYSGKTGAIIDHGAVDKNFGSMASHCIGCTNDAEVVNGIKRAVLGDPDGAVIPGGGVDYTWARLRELEILRGWRNENRGHDRSALEQPPQPSAMEVAACVARTAKHIATIRESLPPCTLLIIYSGTGDPREMARMQDLHKNFKKEYATKKWDQLSVKWTDTEQQALRTATGVARKGIGFVCVT